MAKRTSGRVVRKRAEAESARDGTNSGRLTVTAERQAWFTPETLAAYLQVSDRQVRNLVNDGLLGSYKIGRSRPFGPADGDAFVGQLRGERKLERGGVLKG